MNSLFQKLAERSGKAFSEVKDAWKSAKKSADRKGFKKGGTAHTQHALSALNSACASKPASQDPAPAKEAPKAKAKSPKSE